MKILEPEINALAGCLRAAVVKTGQIYRFYSVTHKLGIQNHAPQPGSLMASLGREIERYDQLCDAIESHLLRAIAVLQRDLAREEKRIRDAQTTPEPAKVATPEPIQVDTLPDEPQGSSGSTFPARRQSTISISSLHRPQFPLKLDLSASSLRLSTEEASSFISTTLHSPVTLAPRSARPLDYPVDLMAALASASSTENRSVDIDLTLPDSTYANTALGNSAEKPIELDLDGVDIDMDMAMDLFGDSAEPVPDSNNVDGLFSPVIPAPSANGKTSPAKEDDSFLNTDIFASLGTDSNVPERSSTVPSPGSLIASFTSGDPVQNASVPSLNLEGLDFPSFLEDPQMDLSGMDDLLSMDTSDVQNIDEKEQV